MAGISAFIPQLNLPRIVFFFSILLCFSGVIPIYDSFLAPWWVSTFRFPRFRSFESGPIRPELVVGKGDGVCNLPIPGATSIIGSNISLYLSVVHYIWIKRYPRYRDYISEAHATDVVAQNCLSLAKKILSWANISANFFCIAKSRMDESSEELSDWSGDLQWSH